MLSRGEQDGKRQLGEIHFWRDGFMGATRAAAEVFSSAKLWGLKTEFMTRLHKTSTETSAASIWSWCLSRRAGKLKKITQNPNFSHRGGAESPLTAAAAAAVYIRQSHNWLPASLKARQTQLAAAGSSFPDHQRQVEPIRCSVQHQNALASSVFRSLFPRVGGKHI